MQEEILARVLLMPDGSIHIAHKNKQTYYCTAEALVLLLSDCSNFLLKGYGRLSTSTSMVNKKQDDITTVRGLTLLTIKTNAEIVCGFPVLFQVLFSALSDSAKTKMCLRISKNILQDCVRYYNNAAIQLYFEYYQACNSLRTTRKNNAYCSQPTTRMIEEILDFPDYTGLSSNEDPADETITEPIVDKSPKQTEEPIITRPKASTPKKFVTVAEFAKIHNLKECTVSTWVWKGKFSSAYKDEKNRWMIDINDTVTDGRKDRKLVPLSDGRKRICLKGTDYESVQKYIKERNLVTDNIRPFIRTVEEMRYYETHSYHEVAWDVGNALIIDINPDYFSNKHGKTNRQLIAEGKAPVVPRKEDYEYVLHHIGQNENSPLAIIPGNEHGDQSLFSVFHIGKTSSEELHGADFNKQKRQFWNEYIKMYDKNDGYRGIKYLNPKNKRKVVQ